jgi:C1A family cysteine protease
LLVVRPNLALVRPNPLLIGQPNAASTTQPNSIELAYLRLQAQAQARLRAQQQQKPQKPQKGKPFRGFDWTLLGVATRVRDQGHAGTCWAHAGVEALEANVEIRTATFPLLAVQPILDQLQDNQGGDALLVFPELIQKGTGLTKDYPYLGGKLNPPEKNPLPYRALTWGYLNKPDKQATVAQIKLGLRLYGPLYTCVTAGTPGWRRNRGEVLAEKGPFREVNHAVLIVGWDDTKKAWKIKNSWGTRWGDGGFGYIAFGRYNIGTGTAWVQARVP